MAIKVFIGVPTAEFGRNAIFYDYLDLLDKPPGTVGAKFHTNSGAWNRNLIIDEALKCGSSHIFFLDDDMAFASDTLMKLLTHDENLVSGLYFNRGYPHSPIIYDKGMDRPEIHYLQDGENGLIEVEACGFGCLLVKTHIFEYLEKPYVRLGEIKQDRRSEDIGFCRRVRNAGFRIHCDLSVPVGHMGMATFWPNYIDGKWYTAIDTNGNEVLNTPQILGEKKEHVKV